MYDARRASATGAFALPDKEIAVAIESLVRPRLAMLVVLLLTLVAVFARPGKAADWEHIQPPDPNVLFNDPAFLRSLAESSSETQAAEAEQRTPEAQAAREASAGEYADLSGHAAQDLAQRTFPELMSRELDPLQLPDGVFVKDYLSPTVASLVNSEGKGSLLVGTQPLAAKDASGELNPIDLTLEATGDAYVPSDPAADVALPERADDFVTFGKSDVGVMAADAPDVMGLRENDRVFYPEVAKDTDFAAMPTPTGAEVMWQLRSEQAGESLPLELDLPAGATVRLASALTAPIGQTVSSAGAGAEIVGEDGVILDTISPPVAYDADGTAIDASYRIDGDRLFVEVPHRSADVKYPVAVDPEVHQVYGQTDLSSCGYDHNWAFAVSGNLFQKYCNNSGYGGYGLYVQSDNGGFYSQGSAGYWWTGTPSYVHIISAWLDGMYHTAAGSHFFAGMADQYGWEPGALFNWNGDMMNGQATLKPSSTFAPNDMNYVEFGLWMDWTGQRPYGLAGIHGANIRLGDYYPPSPVTRYGVNIPLVTDGWAKGVDSTLWLKGNESVSAAVAASDAGLGINNIGVISADSTWYAGHRLIACTGDRSGPCPGSTSYSGGLNLAHFKGVTAYYPFATDITGNSTRGRPFVAKIDPDNPQLAYSGDVVDHANDGYLPQNPGVHIAAYDGSNTAPSLWQSGVKSVHLYVDENDARHQELGWTSTDTACDNCSRGLDFTIPNLTAGTHTLRASVTDYAGRVGGPFNGTPQTISFYYAPTSAQYGGANHEIDLPEEMETVGALLTGANYQAIWDGLATGDKDGMMAGWDSHFASWVPRFDQQPPSAPQSIALDDTDTAQHTALVTWSTGSDPNIATNVQGSGPDLERAEYRFRRSGGSFTDWAPSDDSSATITGVEAYDTFDIDVRGYDAAGNVSPYTRKMLTVPPITAHASLVWFAPLACAAGGCEAILGLGAAVGAAATGWIVADNVHWDVKKVANADDVPVGRGDVQPDVRPGETEAEWQARGKAEKDFLRDDMEREHTIQKGQHAHHIVPHSDPRAADIRRILYKCGIDLNDADNGVALWPKQHFATYGRPYFNALKKLLHRHDPDATISPCDEFRDDPVHGIRATLKKIAQYLKNDTFPY